MPNPGLKIGRVPLPLLPSMMNKIKTRAEKHSISTDRGIEFDSSMISLSNRMWDDALNAIMITVFHSLGLDRSNYEYKLSKVVIEEVTDNKITKVHKRKGVANLIGTLEIQLPSIFKGGSHTIMHSKMKSVFHMGADDSSCYYDSWFLASYADCDQKIQAITKGCRLAVVYSLLRKDSGPASGAPAITEVKQLVRTLRRSTGCAGLFLSGTTPDALARHGFSSLTNWWDRQNIGLLQAASAHMAQGNEPDHLVFHICTASLIVMDDEIRPAALDLDRRIYCPDGSEPSPAARAILSTFHFPEDIIGFEPVKANNDTNINEQGIDILDPQWRNTDPAWNYDRGYSSQVSPAKMSACARDRVPERVGAYLSLCEGKQDQAESESGTDSRFAGSPVRDLRPDFLAKVAGAPPRCTASKSPS
jgi:hypothetical protein